jgi:hypothetical protein
MPLVFGFVIVRVEGLKKTPLAYPVIVSEVGGGSLNWTDTATTSPIRSCTEDGTVTTPSNNKNNNSNNEFVFVL